MNFIVRSLAGPEVPEMWRGDFMLATVAPRRLSLVNFGGNTLAEGLRRIVNDLPPSASPRLRVNKSALNPSPEGLTEQQRS